MNMNGGDASKMCRLCLTEAEVMCPIFSSYSKNNPQNVALPQRIMSFAQIKVAENDGLPSSICYQCLAQVDKSYQFKLQCEQADAMLRQNLQDDQDCESDNGDWPMITPEVILNEGEDNSDDMNESQGESFSQQCESDSEQSYPLQEVQALLRTHGTEIRLQPVNGNGSDKQASTSNGHVYEPKQHTPLNSNGSNIPLEYYPVYGVEAVLNNGPVYRSASNGLPLPALLPRLPITASLSSLLQRKGEISPEISLLSNGSENNANGKSRRSRDGQKLFQCRLCPKSYSFSSALSRHKAVHNTQLRPHVCQVCRKGFSDPDKLERHTRTHSHGGDLGHQLRTLFPCNICGRVFKALATLEKHRMMTQGKCRQFSCMMCGLGFPNKTKLKLHPCRAAGVDRLFPCPQPQCEQVLNSMEAFEAHVSSHGGLPERSATPQALSLVTTGDHRRSV